MITSLLSYQQREQRGNGQSAEGRAQIDTMIKEKRIIDFEESDGYGSRQYVSQTPQ